MLKLFIDGSFRLVVCRFIYVLVPKEPFGILKSHDSQADKIGRLGSFLLEPTLKLRVRARQDFIQFKVYPQIETASRNYSPNNYLLYLSKDCSSDSGIVRMPVTLVRKFVSPVYLGITCACK